jgi:hypothetical protein
MTHRIRPGVSSLAPREDRSVAGPSASSGQAANPAVGRNPAQRAPGMPEARHAPAGNSAPARRPLRDMVAQEIRFAQRHLRESGDGDGQLLRRMAIDERAQHHGVRTIDTYVGPDTHSLPAGKAIKKKDASQRIVAEASAAAGRLLNNDCLQRAQAQRNNVPAMFEGMLGPAEIEARRAAGPSRGGDDMFGALPGDVLRRVADHLSPEDTVHFSQVSRAARWELGTQSTAARWEAGHLRSFSQVGDMASFGRALQALRDLPRKAVVRDPRTGQPIEGLYGPVTVYASAFERLLGAVADHFDDADEVAAFDALLERAAGASEAERPMLIEIMARSLHRLRSCTPQPLHEMIATLPADTPGQRALRNELTVLMRMGSNDAQEQRDGLAAWVQHFSELPEHRRTRAHLNAMSVYNALHAPNGDLPEDGSESDVGDNRSAGVNALYRMAWLMPEAERFHPDVMRHITGAFGDLPSEQRLGEFTLLADMTEHRLAQIRGTDDAMPAAERQAAHSTTWRIVAGILSATAHLDDDSPPQGGRSQLADGLSRAIELMGSIADPHTRIDIASSLAERAMGWLSDPRERLQLFNDTLGILSQGPTVGRGDDGVGLVHRAQGRLGALIETLDSADRQLAEQQLAATSAIILR